MDALSRIGVVGSAVAFVTAVCCILPVVLMMIGLGGSWLAVFGVIADAGYHVAAVSAILLAAGWIIAVRRRVGRSTFAALGAGTVATAAAWAIVSNESAINDYLISLM